MKSISLLNVVFIGLQALYPSLGQSGVYPVTGIIQWCDSREQRQWLIECTVTAATDLGLVQQSNTNVTSQLETRWKGNLKHCMHDGHVARLVNYIDLAIGIFFYLAACMKKIMCHLMASYIGLQHQGKVLCHVCLK
jgi:hypothetical protein